MVAAPARGETGAAEYADTDQTGSGGMHSVLELPGIYIWCLTPADGNKWSRVQLSVTAATATALLVGGQNREKTTSGAAGFAGFRAEIAVAAFSAGLASLWVSRVTPHTDLFAEDTILCFLETGHTDALVPELLTVSFSASPRVESLNSMATRATGVSRRELFGSLCVLVFLVNLARVIFAPLLQPVAAEFGVSAAALGIVTSAAWLGSAAPRAPTGLLLTRFQRHHVIAATGGSLVLTSAFTAIAGSVAHLTLGAFLMGLASGSYFIAANPLVSELFPSRVGTALGLHGTASQIAAVAAPLVVSAVLIVGSWRSAFAAIAVVAALGTAGLVVAARRTTLPEAGLDDRSLLTAGRAQWPIILTGIAFIATTGFLWNALFNLYGDYLTVAKGVDPATGRLLLSAMFGAGVPAFVVTGWLADRVPYVPLLLSIVGSFTLSVLLLTVVDGLLALAATSLLVGYSIHSLFPAMDTYMLDSLPDQHRASAYALYSAVMMVAQALGSGTVGTAVSRGAAYTQTFQSLAAGLGGVVIVLAVLHWRGYLPAGGR